MVLAFVIGRATAGGDAETTAASKVESTTTTTTARPFTHVIGPGDTLSSIAAEYGITLAQLKEANGITNDIAPLGVELNIPRAPKVTKTSSTTVP